MKNTYILSVAVVLLIGGYFLVPSRETVLFSGQDTQGEPYRTASSTAFSITATAGSNGQLVRRDVAIENSANPNTESPRYTRIENNDGSNAAWLCLATTTAHVHTVTDLDLCYKITAGEQVIFDTANPYLGSIIATSSANMTLTVVERSF